MGDALIAIVGKGKLNNVSLLVEIKIIWLVAMDNNNSSMFFFFTVNFAR